jgi:hypothetical protein
VSSGSSFPDVDETWSNDVFLGFIRGLLRVGIFGFEDV